jgi:transcriptional regulator with XRE-family HTH domain
MMGAMPGAALTATPEQRERLADHVRRRRNALGLSQEDLGASRSVVSNLEGKRQETFSPRSIAKITAALGWTPDSIERILAGLDPIIYGGEDAYADPSIEAKVSRIERELAHIRAELEATRAENQRHRHDLAYEREQRLRMEAVAVWAVPNFVQMVNDATNDPEMLTDEEFAWLGQFRDPPLPRIGYLRLAKVKRAEVREELENGTPAERPA